MRPSIDIAVYQTISILIESPILSRQPEPIYTKLREQLFSLDPAELTLRPVTPDGRALGVVMDMGYPDAVATLVGLADRTTSLYFTGGQGIIGAGAHDAVWDATRAWLSEADRSGHLLGREPGDGLPGVGTVRFHVLTAGGWTASGEDAEDALGNRQSPLSPLFYAAQGVITQLRLVDEAQS
jgi:hypothetical protein